MAKVKSKPTHQRKGKSYPKSKETFRDRKTERSQDATTDLQRGKEKYEPQDGNDPEWWSHSPQLLRDAASVPFTEVLGLKTDWGCPQGYGAFPGVCGFRYLPVPGDQEEPDSPINVCARNLMALIRSKISGQRSYDSPNIMIYLLAISQLYGVYADVTRMYGLMRNYSIRNRYMPKAFFDIRGWDYDDFMVNQANFRLWINTLGEKIGSLCFPGDLDFTKRAMWMNSRIFLDGPTTKAQMYFFYPAGMLKYMYNSEDAQRPISLDIVPLGPDADSAISDTNAFWKFEDLQRAVDVVVQSLVEKEDIAVMSGDFLKTFGSNGLWHLPPIAEDYMSVPELNDYALQQIHNMTIIPSAFMNYKTDPKVIYEYADTVNSRTWLKSRARGTVAKGSTSAATLPNFSGLLNWIGTWTSPSTTQGRREGKILLNSYKEIPDEHDIIEMTRLTPAIIVSPGSTTGTLDFLVRAATEVIVGAAISVPAFYEAGKIGANVIQFRAMDAVSQSQPVYQLVNWNPVSIPHTERVRSLTPLVTDLSSLFDWFPLQYRVKGTTGTVSDEDVQIAAQLENYTFVSESVIRNMHYVAQLSIYSIPGAAVAV